LRVTEITGSGIGKRGPDGAQDGRDRENTGTHPGEMRKHRKTGLQESQVPIPLLHCPIRTHLQNTKCKSFKMSTAEGSTSHIALIVGGLCFMVTLYGALQSVEPWVATLVTGP
jgi:hypothetical protein